MVSTTLTVFPLAALLGHSLLNGFCALIGLVLIVSLLERNGAAPLARTRSPSLAASSTRIDQSHRGYRLASDMANLSLVRLMGLALVALIPVAVAAISGSNNRPFWAGLALRSGLRLGHRRPYGDVALHAPAALAPRSPAPGFQSISLRCSWNGRFRSGLRHPRRLTG